MFENPRRGRQARNFTTKVPKILDLKSCSEQIFSENWRWVPWENELSFPLAHVLMNDFTGGSQTLLPANVDLPVLGGSKNKSNWKSISPIDIPERRGDWGACTGLKIPFSRRSIPGRVSVGRLIAVFPTKKAGKIGATNLPPTFESDGRETKLVTVCRM